MLLAVSTFNFVTSILNYNDSKEMWPMFLTKWGFMLGYSYLLSSTVTVIAPLKLMKLTWGLFAASINIQMFITINFWVLVYDGSTEPFSSYYEVSGAEIIPHHVFYVWQVAANYYMLFFLITFIFPFDLLAWNSFHPSRPWWICYSSLSIEIQADLFRLVCSHPFLDLVYYSLKAWNWKFFA